MSFKDYKNLIVEAVSKVNERHTPAQAHAAADNYHDKGIELMLAALGEKDPKKQRKLLRKMGEYDHASMVAGSLELKREGTNEGFKHGKEYDLGDGATYMELQSDGGKGRPGSVSGTTKPDKERPQPPKKKKIPRNLDQGPPGSLFDSDIREGKRRPILPDTAIQILNNLKAHGDYHALPTDTVLALGDYAKQYGYRRPKNANGSKTRYFHAHLQRRARGINEEVELDEGKKPHRFSIKEPLLQLDPGDYEVMDTTQTRWIGNKGFSNTNVKNVRTGKVSSIPTGNAQLMGLLPYNEEVEKLDELDGGTLSKYIQKRASDLSYAKDDDKATKYTAGIQRAAARLGGSYLHKTNRRKIGKNRYVANYITSPYKEKQTYIKFKEETLHEEMSHEARELMLHADNDEHLYRSNRVPIIKNLQRKHDKGKYDHEKAKKLWGYHADNAAKSYAKTYGSGQAWHKMFSTSARREAASAWADEHRDEHKWGTK